jgi:hypothetical protein
VSKFKFLAILLNTCFASPSSKFGLLHRLHRHPHFLNPSSDMLNPALANPCKSF